MSSIKLLGETSGEVVLKAPTVAGASEATLPTGSHTLVGSGQIVGMATADSTTTFTNKSGNISQWTNDSGYMTATHTGNLDITGNGTFSGNLTVDTSTLVVDSSNNRVGIGTTSPNNQLDVYNASGNAGMNITSSSTGTSFINFADIDDNDRGQISYVNTDDSFRIKVEDTEKFRMKGSGDFHADGDVVAYSTTVSDVALKTDIEMIPNALDKIDEVRGVTFTRHNGQKSAGIIAQELEKVLPEAVREKELDLIDGKTYKTVEYDAIHGLLINCIKELKEEIKELKNGITK